jgi:DNA (cytosine-5)-methyltransferase 1
MSNSQIESVSLFSGAGGLDIGSELNGVKVRLAIDFDHDSIETLKLNNKSKKKQIIKEDIKNLKPKAIEKYLGNKNIIIIGGPPCQPFSKNGYWVKNENRKITKDPRNCIEDYFDYVKNLNPKVFLLENVESILHPTNKKAIECIINHTKKLNYHLKIIKANALDYGVPQKRQRIFFIGSKKKFQITEPQKTHFNPEKPSLFDNNLKPYETVGSHIKDFENSIYKEDAEVATEGTYYNELKKVPPGKNYLALCNQKGSKFIKNTRFWNFLLKLSPDLPSWTIAAQPGPWVGPFHWTNRRLRVPEIAAIQTFPKNYKFFGSRRSVQRQIGNAVPPLLGKQMVKFLANNLS